MGKSFEFFPMSWPKAIESLDHGQIDLISMIYSEERAKKYQFSMPHSRIYQALFVHRLNGPKDLTELSGKRVAFQNNDISLERLEYRNDFERVIVSSKNEGFSLLQKGDVDAFFTSESSGDDYIRDHGFRNFIVAKALGGLFEQAFCFAALKQNKALIDKLDQAIVQEKRSGKLSQLQGKWLHHDSSIWEDHSPLIVSVLSVILLLIILLNIHQMEPQ